MSAEAARPDRELQMLEAMVDCAHELALAFGQAAKADGATAHLDAFLRSFQAARLGIRLCLTLRAGRTPAAVAHAQEPADAERPEPMETERAERFDAPERPERDEIERDRDHEPVSLPKFLSSLRAAAAAASERAADLPAHIGARTLPTLDQLLAQASSRPADAAEPRSTGGTDVLLVRTSAPYVPPRARLMGSAAAPPGTLPRPPPRRSS